MKVLTIFVATIISLRAMAYMSEYVDGVKWNYTVENGKAILGGGASGTQAIYKDKSGEITIPSKLGAFPVTGIGESAFSCCCKLTSVIIPEGVVDIREGAFSACSLLKSVIMPNSITYIGDRAFYNCGLTRVTLPACVTNVGRMAFSSCGNLERVLICDGVDSIGEYAFENCCNLKSIDIPASVKNIGNSAFKECKKLSDLTIRDGVENIDKDAFYLCSGLKKIVVPQSVTNIDSWAFEYCTGVTEVEVPSTTRLGAAVFYGCGGLIDDDGFVIVNNVLYDYDERSNGAIVPDGVIRIDVGVFSSYDSELTSVILPASVKSIGDDAFGNCHKLTNIVFIGNSPNVEQGAFRDITSRCTASVYYGSTGWDNDGDGYWNKLKLRYLAREGQIGFDDACSFSVDGLDGQISIPNEWLISKELAKEGDNIDDATTTILSVGMNGLPRYKSYILGLEPDSDVSAEEQFKVTINGFDENGSPLISYEPTPNDISHVTIKKLGRKTLSSSDNWEEVPSGSEAEYNFFRVSAEIK